MEWRSPVEFLICTVWVATRLYQVMNVISDHSVQSVTENFMAYWLLSIDYPLISLMTLIGFAWYCRIPKVTALPWDFVGETGCCLQLCEAIIFLLWKKKTFE